MRTFLLPAIAAGLLLSAATLNASTIVYDNGAINGTINAFSIANIADFVVSDSFTLSAPATLTGADVGLWVDLGDTVSSFTWSIGTSFYDTSLGNGNVVPSNSLWGTAFGLFDVYDSTFTLPSISLAAGTYYLTLSNGVTGNTSNIFWDETDGPSLATMNALGPIGSESFRLSGNLIGQQATVPEPGTFAALGLGLVGLGLLRRRIRR